MSSTSQANQPLQSVEVAGCFAKPVLSEIEGLNMTTAFMRRILELGDYDRAFSRAINVSAIVAGVSAIAIPAAFSASIFPAAVPFPPETMAPA
jgi:hypothetical protein